MYTELRRNINVFVIDYDSHSVIDLIEQVLERNTEKLKVTPLRTHKKPLFFLSALKITLPRGFFSNKHLGHTILVFVSIRVTLPKVI